MHAWLMHITPETAMNPQQHEKIKSAKGFIAALDQSGGSTPKALTLYGIKPDTYSGDQQMFDMIHAMRTRIITSPAFNGDRVLGAILFEGAMLGGRYARRLNEAWLKRIYLAAVWLLALKALLFDIPKTRPTPSTN